MAEAFLEYLENLVETSSYDVGTEEGGMFGSIVERPRPSKFVPEPIRSQSPVAGQCSADTGACTQNAIRPDTFGQHQMSVIGLDRNPAANHELSDPESLACQGDDVTATTPRHGWTFGDKPMPGKGPVLNQRLIDIGLYYLNWQPKMLQAEFRKRLITDSWYTSEDLPSRTTIGRLYRKVKPCLQVPPPSEYYNTHAALQCEESQVDLQGEASSPHVVPSSGTTATSVRTRLITTDRSRRIMEDFYLHTSYPESSQYDDIAEQTDLSRRKVRIWFNNRRSKQRQLTKSYQMAYSQQQREFIFGKDMNISGGQERANQHPAQYSYPPAVTPAATTNYQQDNLIGLYESYSPVSTPVHWVPINNSTRQDVW